MELTRQQKLLQQVIAEAWDNPIFKQELLASPIEAIKTLTGEIIKIPEGKTLQVFDQSSPEIIAFNIPPKPDLNSIELTDEELEIVAGGAIPVRFSPPSIF